MGSRFDRQCVRCKSWEVEEIDDWISDQCPHCNDRAIEHANKRREWNYYHSDEKTHSRSTRTDPLTLNPPHGRDTMSAPRWIAVNEVGNDNFATSIYENDWKGLLVARCNQNGTYPEQAALIIKALEFSNVVSLFPSPPRQQ